MRAFLLVAILAASLIPSLPSVSASCIPDDFNCTTGGQQCYGGMKESDVGFAHVSVSWTCNHGGTWYGVRFTHWCDAGGFSCFSNDVVMAGYCTPSGDGSAICPTDLRGYTTYDSIDTASV